MKKLILSGLFSLIILAGLGQELAFIGSDTTKRPPAGLAKLAVKNNNPYLVRNSGSTLKLALKSDLSGQNIVQSSNYRFATDTEKGKWNANKVAQNVSELRTTVGVNGDKTQLLGYYRRGDGGGGEVYWDSNSTLSDNGGTVFQVAGVTTGRWCRVCDREINIKWFGAKDILTESDTSYNSTTDILNAINALRKNPKTILNYIGGSNITAYSSGVLIVPSGVFLIDSIIINQDLGLIIRGAGSRRTNNAIRAASTLLLRGTNGGCGIRFTNNGSRGGLIEDIDICYQSSGFTGDILDVLSSPGFSMNRTFLGTYGIASADRLKTARSCIRTSYNEFLNINNCVFDGAVNGWWLDDVRTVNSNTFGGSSSYFSSCNFNDFTGTMILSSGTKTKITVNINSCVFNPINSNCTRAIDLDNVNGLIINSCLFTPSTGSYATAEWIKLNNVTGTISNNSFNDLSKAGTINGYVNISGNSIFCTDGFTVVGGIIIGGNNEFSKGTAGWTIAPTSALSFNLQPDIFKSLVTNSYLVSFDSTYLNGKINYDVLSDGSISGFSNPSNRVQILNVNNGLSGISSISYTVLIKNTGKTHTATGSATQTFTLPDAVAGTKLSFFKPSSQILTINCFSGDNFYKGASTVSGTISSPATSIGSFLELEAYGTAGWRVLNIVGTWN